MNIIIGILLLTLAVFLNSAQLSSQSTFIPRGGHNYPTRRNGRENIDTYILQKVRRDVQVTLPNRNIYISNGEGNILVEYNRITKYAYVRQGSFMDSIGPLPQPDANGHVARLGSPPGSSSRDRA